MTEAAGGRTAPPRTAGSRSRSPQFERFFAAVEKAKPDGEELWLSRIAEAGERDQHWTANAWLLERTNPEYRRRSQADVGFAPETVREYAGQLFDALYDAVLPFVPESERDRVKSAMIDAALAIEVAG